MSRERAAWQRSTPDAWSCADRPQQGACQSAPSLMGHCRHTRGRQPRRFLRSHCNRGAGACGSRRLRQQAPGRAQVHFVGSALVPACALLLRHGRLLRRDRRVITAFTCLRPVQPPACPSYVDASSGVLVSIESACKPCLNLRRACRQGTWLAARPCGQGRCAWVAAHAPGTLVPCRLLACPPPPPPPFGGPWGHCHRDAAKGG